MAGIFIQWSMRVVIYLDLEGVYLGLQIGTIHDREPILR
jgi:hypothetical protein